MSEWLDTPEGEECINAGMSALVREYHGSEIVEYDTARRVLAAALDVRVDCAACGGSGYEHHLTSNPAPDDGPCGNCDGTGTVPVLYPREEKP